MSIKTIIVDDEPRAIKGLKVKLQKLFPQLDIIGTFTDAQKAVIAINHLQPNLVFMDITMPVLTGFEVLTKVDNPSFELIFVTAHSDYGIQAIKHAAIGYVVKPIEDAELILAVNQAQKNLLAKNALHQNLNLISHLSSTHITPKIAIPSQKGIKFINTDEIIRFSGVDGYTKIYFTNEPAILSSYSIGKFAEMVKDQSFFACHKSHLINLRHIKGLSNNGIVQLIKGEVPCSKAKRSELLAQIY